MGSDPHGSGEQCTCAGRRVPQLCMHAAGRQSAWGSLGLEAAWEPSWKPPASAPRSETRLPGLPHSKSSCSGQAWLGTGSPAPQE